MPRKANQSSEWNFKVKTERMHRADGSPTNMFATVREDTGHVFGQVSEKGYGLLQNEDFIFTVREALNGLGLNDFTENVIVTDNGAKLYATYSFDNRIKTLHKVGDKVGLVLRFADSKDGTVSAQGELLAKVLRCLNGMSLEQGQFSLRQRHTVKINLDFVKDVIGKAVNDFDAALAVFDRLAEISLTDEQGVNALGHLGLSEKVRESIKGLWINPNFAESRARNLYSLYDAATEYLRDIEKERFVHATTLNRAILRKLVRALDPEQFTLLTAKIETNTVNEIEVSGATEDTTPGEDTPGEENPA
jgi:hypothetical protein